MNTVRTPKYVNSCVIVFLITVILTEEKDKVP